MEAHQGGFFYVREPADMKFNKPPLSIDQQLRRLCQRGMQVADHRTAKERLRHINYYRLRAYWLPDEIPGEKPGEHRFRPGTQFETILDLYNFDRKLRLMVLDSRLRGNDETHPHFPSLQHHAPSSPCTRGSMVTSAVIPQSRDPRLTYTVIPAKAGIHGHRSRHPTKSGIHSPYTVTPVKARIHRKQRIAA